MPRRVWDWLKQAKRNLASARVNADAELYEEACFESHQAAEKALKALLQFLGIDRRGRSLVFLAREAEVKGLIVIHEVRRCLLKLDKHYIPSRYPDVYDEGAPADYYSRDDAEECIRCAEYVVAWVEERVGEAVQEV
ncbi:MAG: HEPN domain-containing protein [Desulfurococcales archaeon]|nr:HEPN domain-containing protein [Desulfurococcales archaeon]